MKTFTYLAAAAIVSSVSAFAPSAGFVRSTVSLQMADAAPAQDTNFEGIDLARLLGAKRLSNIKRKLKREKSAAQEEK